MSKLIDKMGKKTKKTKPPVIGEPSEIIHLVNVKIDPITNQLVGLPEEWLSKLADTNIE